VREAIETEVPSQASILGITQVAFYPCTLGPWEFVTTMHGHVSQPLLQFNLVQVPYCTRVELMQIISAAKRMKHPQIGSEP
jgi:hypothetical protein